MRIVMMAVNDPAGTAIGFTKALNRHTVHTCRLLTLETRYTHGWEKDLHIPDMGPEELAEVEHLLKTADVFHFHMTADEHLRFGPHLPADHMRGKLVVHHHHGHPDFRGNPGKYQDKYARLGRSKLLVSTPDLLRLLPEATWQPNLVQQTHPLLLPMGGKPETPVRVAHSPTRKDLKNTDDLLHTLEELRADGPGTRIDLRLDLIDDVPHRQCLRRKRRCHILFDHMQGYFGVSSLEGLSQGLAVVSGLDEWCGAHVREFTGLTNLPWAVASPATLRDVLKRLATDADQRAELCKAGRRMMETVWSEERVAARLGAFYET
jgi:hypothetical protein